MLHTFAIAFHAASAIAAFIVGITLIFQSDAHWQLQAGRAILVLLSLMELFLIIAILSHLTGLSITKQLIFGGLALLVMYMIWRAVQAVVVLTRHAQDEQVTVIGHIGFVLISLFDGFAIVSALDLHAPGWLVAIIAVSAVGAGVWGIHIRKSMLQTRLSSIGRTRQTPA